MKPTLKLVLLFFLSLTACHKETVSEIVPTQTPDYVVPTIRPNGNEQYLSKKSEYIFDQEKLATYQLLIPTASLSKLDSDPAKEEYVEGTLIFEGDTISPVGIRYKGSIGTFFGCTTGTDWQNPSGSKTCSKLSMKIKINWAGREERFYGLNKLQFHDQKHDISQLRERLGYWLFQEMGVPSPRSVHAKVYINGVYSGLYGLIEEVDGRFAKYNFEDDGGNVYKEVWPLTQKGVPQDDQTYFDALRTNEDENPSIDIIREFSRKLSLSDSSNVQSLIEEYMDIKEIISYAVVDRLIRHDDGPFHWYCHTSPCTNHNYYWYEEPSNKKLHLIPWDLDVAFVQIVNGNFTNPRIADKWGEVSHNCNEFIFGRSSLRQWSAGCDRLTSGWTLYKNEYASLRKHFQDNILTKAEAKIDIWSLQIESALLQDINTQNEVIKKHEAWRAALSDLKTKIRFSRNEPL